MKTASKKMDAETRVRKMARIKALRSALMSCVDDQFSTAKEKKHWLYVEIDCLNRQLGLTY